MFCVMTLRWRLPCPASPAPTFGAPRTSKMQTSTRLIELRSMIFLPLRRQPNWRSGPQAVSHGERADYARVGTADAKQSQGLAIKSSRLLLIGQERFEIRKRRMGGGATVARVAARARFELPLMLIVVTVQAEQLPIAAVGRVVVMI